MKKLTNWHNIIINTLDKVCEEKDIWFTEDAYPYVAEIHGMTTSEVSELIDEIESRQEMHDELRFNK